MKEEYKKLNTLLSGTMGAERGISNLDTDNIYLKALHVYGIDAQLGMLQEECAELIVEVNHIKRSERANFNLLIGEIVDVEIMLSQIKFLFPSDEYNKIKEEKTKALQNRLNLL